MLKNKIKKMWIILVIVCVGLLLMIPFAMALTSSPQKKQKKSKQYDKLQLIEYSTEEKYHLSHELIMEQYKICPPLRPERFRRKMKMLWGIDINDYPENSTIIMNSSIYLSRKYQIINGHHISLWAADDIPLAPPLSDSIYSLCRQFLFFDDTSVYTQLDANKYTYTEYVLPQNKYYQMYKKDFLRFYDILTNAYQGMIMTPTPLLNYIDVNNPKAGHSGSEVLNNMVVINPFISRRTFDMKGDLLSLYIRKQCKARGITVGYDEDQKKTDIFIRDEGFSLLYTPKTYAGNLDMHFPWHNFNLARSFAGNLSFFLQLRCKKNNSFIIKYMSGQFDESDIYSYLRKERQDSIRNLIRSNNYYGYAILREFCENPEREMPTLEKIGTSFNAKVVPSKTLLYLEPYPDSYDIDTIKQEEIFKVYEMGYDDYYFVEVIKPVESPVAGPDGYAMILDRTETVYGYIRKSEVKEVSESEIESQKIKTQSGKHKLGLIDDPDGYVNIRKSMSTESEVIEKIEEKELFFYWEIADSNWWYVETKDAVKGFVHKSRIKEKIDAGGWIIDE